MQCSLSVLAHKVCVQLSYICAVCWFVECLESPPWQRPGCVCVCGAVNIDFTTSPSLCLSVTGARGGDGTHTLSRTQRSPAIGGVCLPSDLQTWRSFLAQGDSKFDSVCVDNTQGKGVKLYDMLSGVLLFVMIQWVTKWEVLMDTTQLLKPLCRYMSFVQTRSEQPFPLFVFVEGEGKQNDI